MKRSPRAPAKKCLQWSSWILQRMDALNVDFEGIRLDLQNLHDHAYPRKADWLLPPPKVILLWGHLILASSDEFHLMSVTSGWVCMLLHAQLWPWCSACPLQGPFGPDCVLFAVFSAPDSPLGRFFFLLHWIAWQAWQLVGTQWFKCAYDLIGADGTSLLTYPFYGVIVALLDCFCVCIWFQVLPERFRTRSKFRPLQNASHKEKHASALFGQH
jgi:hypothetical protein